MNRASRIGIMADSHGHAHNIARALGRLTDLGCTRLVHLGDVCDTLCPETADACADLLREHGVVALKGNNDHNVLVNLREREQDLVRPDTLEWLAALPWVRRMDGAVFAHSLPFDAELGLVAMVADMQDAHMHKWFAEGTASLLFRGHSHAPKAVWQNGGGLASRDLTPGETLSLEHRLPLVVTCGALADGLCMLWDREAGEIRLLSL